MKRNRVKIVTATLHDGTPVLGTATKDDTDISYPATFQSEEEAQAAAQAARKAGHPHAHVRRVILTATTRYVALDDADARLPHVQPRHPGKG